MKGWSGSSCSGISLTAGWGVPAGYAFPDKLEFALRARGQSASVANAGVSGDTAAMGLARLNRSITDDTDAVILELGANDMLRDSSQISLARRSRRFYATSKPGELSCFFAGCGPNPALETNTRSAFAAMFSGLASEHNVLFYPAFDDAFMDNAQLKLPDGLHPTAAGNRSDRHSHITTSRGADRPRASPRRRSPPVARTTVPHCRGNGNRAMSEFEMQSGKHMLGMSSSHFD